MTPTLYLILECVPTGHVSWHGPFTQGDVNRIITDIDHDRFGVPFKVTVTEVCPWL